MGIYETVKAVSRVVRVKSELADHLKTLAARALKDGQQSAAEELEKAAAILRKAPDVKAGLQQLLRMTNQSSAPVPIRSPPAGSRRSPA